MTADEIRKLPPGTKLDALAALAMGWEHRKESYLLKWVPPNKGGGQYDPPPISTDWAYAGPALELYGENTCLHRYENLPGWYVEAVGCLFVPPPVPTGPHAIALAWALIGAEKGAGHG